MYNRINYFLPALLAVLFVSTVIGQQAQIYPDSTWATSDAKDKGDWMEDRLQKMKHYVVDSTEATGMMVVYRGKVLFQYGDVQELSYIASCRKSILSMLYGPFVTSGKINLDTDLRELNIDDIQGLSAIEKTATIRDLLTARSGIYHPASNEGDATAMAPKRGTVRPGSFWLYNNWDFNAAGFILEKLTGNDIYELVDSVLAKPIGMEDWQISAQHKMGDTTRSRFKAYHMWYSTRDMARLGYLMLRKGKWKDRVVLSPEWVKTITATVTPYEEALKNKTNYFQFGYGYLWWIWDKSNISDPAFEGAFTATGAFGQFITVLPKLDLVVAFKTKYEYERQTPTDKYLTLLGMLVDAHNAGK